MDGGDRAGYKQIAGAVDAVLITSTMSGAATTGDFVDFEVISSYAAVAAIVAPGLTNASKLTSARALPLGSKVKCSQITSIRLSVKSTGHKVIAHKRILI